jgi:hypothetical protein
MNVCYSASLISGIETMGKTRAAGFRGTLRH